MAEKTENLKIAVGHDDLTVPYAGGEKIFFAIAEIFPQADIFTSMITREWGERLPGREITATFMQRIPFKRKLQKVLFPLYPIAFESLDFSDYDLVISSSSRFAHGAITKPETRHLCYMHSPGRMFWEPEKYFQDSPQLGKILSPILSYLRLWDYTAAQRVDRFVANSKNIAGKIKKYYGREAAVVHPFVDLERFRPAGGSGGYFLVVTRLQPWKRVEIAVEAAKQAGAELKIVGSGPDLKRLKNLAAGRVEVLGGLEDEEVTELFQNCTAFIMTQEEDFGITSLEAQACGKPVIAYGAGGALETVVPGKTGEFFSSQTSEALVNVLKGFDPKKYNADNCRANAERFSQAQFRKGILREVGKALSSR